MKFANYISPYNDQCLRGVVDLGFSSHTVTRRRALLLKLAVLKQQHFLLSQSLSCWLIFILLQFPSERREIQEHVFRSLHRELDAQLLLSVMRIAFLITCTSC